MNLMEEHSLHLLMLCSVESAASCLTVVPIDCATMSDVVLSKSMLVRSHVPNDVMIFVMPEVARS